MKEVNINYYQQLLDKGRFEHSDKKFYQSVLNSVKKQGGKATDRQYNILQQIKFGKTTYSPKNEHIYNKKLTIMKHTQLRQLIKESIQEYIREVETSGNIAAQEAKIRACEEAIALREKKVNMEGLDEAYHDMMDSTKLNELKKEVKELQKYKTKAEKLLEKMKAKAEGKTAPKKMEDEGMDEGTVDEVNLDEYTADPASGPELEEAKMTKAEKAKKEDIVKGMKKSKSFGKSKEEKGKMYATATKLAMKESVETEGEVLNEQFLHMQKLAGLITETQYKQKLNKD